jgi:hypothetical protein
MTISIENAAELAGMCEAGAQRARENGDTPHFNVMTDEALFVKAYMKVRHPGIAYWLNFSRRRCCCGLGDQTPTGKPYYCVQHQRWSDK